MNIKLCGILTEAMVTLMNFLNVHPPTNEMTTGLRQ